MTLHKNTMTSTEGSLFARSDVQASLHAPNITLNHEHHEHYMKSSHQYLQCIIESTRTTKTSNPHISHNDSIEVTSYRLSNPVEASKHRTLVPCMTHHTAHSLTLTSSPVLRTHTAGLSAFFAPSSPSSQV